MRASNDVSGPHSHCPRNAARQKRLGDLGPCELLALRLLAHYELLDFLSLATKLDWHLGRLHAQNPNSKSPGGLNKAAGAGLRGAGRSGSVGRALATPGKRVGPASAGDRHWQVPKGGRLPRRAELIGRGVEKWAGRPRSADSRAERNEEIVPSPGPRAE